MVSYLTYANPTFQENYILITLEYGIVLGALLYEVGRKQPLLQHF